MHDDTPAVVVCRNKSARFLRVSPHGIMDTFGWRRYTAKTYAPTSVIVTNNCRLLDLEIGNRKLIVGTERLKAAVTRWLLASQTLSFCPFSLYLFFSLRHTCVPTSSTRHKTFVSCDSFLKARIAHGHMAPPSFFLLLFRPFAGH